MWAGWPNWVNPKHFTGTRRLLALTSPLAHVMVPTKTYSIDVSVNDNHLQCLTSSQGTDYDESSVMLLPNPIRPNYYSMATWSSILPSDQVRAYPVVARTLREPGMVYTCGGCQDATTVRCFPLLIRSELRTGLQSAGDASGLLEGNHSCHLPPIRDSQQARMDIDFQRTGCTGTARATSNQGRAHDIGVSRLSEVTSRDFLHASRAYLSQGSCVTSPSRILSHRCHCRLQTHDTISGLHLLGTNVVHPTGTVTNEWNVNTAAAMLVFDQDINTACRIRVTGPASLDYAECATQPSLIPPNCNVLGTPRAYQVVVPSTRLGLGLLGIAKDRPMQVLNERIEVRQFPMPMRWRRVNHMIGSRCRRSHRRLMSPLLGRPRSIRVGRSTQVFERFRKSPHAEGRFDVSGWGCKTARLELRSAGVPRLGKRIPSARSS
jgi:hypothetical protein